MKKRWINKTQGDNDVIQQLCAELNVENQIGNMLAQRGISTFEGARSFFRPQLTDLYDPFLMKDMDKAISRINAAIINNEKILVYGDYDVDGTSAVALVFSFFYSRYKNIEFYIPDRYLEGYGISIQGIDFACDNNFKLVIALDCGIKAVEKIQYAKEKGLEFIICDHHRPGAQLPEATAVLDPKRSDCNYPYTELSGCGIGFKLIQGYAQQFGIPLDEIYAYFDLVAVSIASDIVDITGENRTLAYFGLLKINSDPCPGIEAVLYHSGLKRKTPDQLQANEKNIFGRQLNINDLVFIVGPRINAAGRMESGRNSVELLVAQNFDHALEIGKHIDNYNTERRSLDNLTTQEALDMLASDDRTKISKATVVFKETWHKGVIGIVASRLTEHYYKPTIVLTRSNGVICGSARSVKDFDVYDAIDSCNDLLEHFGGHKYAAGLSIIPENLPEFCRRFENYVAANIKEEMLTPEIEIDAVLELKEITPKFFRILQQFAPFGPGNMCPVFQTDNLIGEGRVVGKNHLKLSVSYREKSGGPFDAIAFQMGDFGAQITKGAPFDICYHVDENIWNNVVSLQLNIRDIRIRK